MSKRFNSIVILSSLIVIAVSVITVEANAQGIYLSGVGAVNRSMGSASVAAPVDSAGAINYNPATMGALAQSEAQAGTELFWANSSVSSRIGAYNLSGSSDDDSGVSPIPAFSLVRKQDNSDFTYGLGFFGVAGFRVDYASSTTNPILFPQEQGGLGRVVGSADYFQLMPAGSYRIAERTYFGFAPILTIAKLEANPYVFAGANSDGTYASGLSPNYRYGGGFQLGVYHETDSGINLGAAYKSTQWMESDTVNTTNSDGTPRQGSFALNLPTVASLGVSYSAIEQLLLAVDVRYLDYGNARGFEDHGYRADGSMRGLGWDSIWSVSTGVQYTPFERVAFRLGYTHNENPISSNDSMFNVASPLVIKDVVGIGTSYQLLSDLSLSITYLHGFHNSVSGPIETPAGQAPDTSVKNSTSAHAIAVALTQRF